MHFNRLYITSPIKVVAVGMIREAKAQPAKANESICTKEDGRKILVRFVSPKIQKSQK